MKKKTEARREAILEAAKAVFLERGFDQATMSEITARVGGSKATLYRYFNSKATLFMEMIQTSMAQRGFQILSLLNTSPSISAEQSQTTNIKIANPFLIPDEDFVTTLTRVGEGILKYYYTQEWFATRRMLIAAAKDPDIGKLFYINGHANEMKHVEAYFEDVIKAGKLRQADTRVLAAHFRSLMGSEIYELGLFNVLPKLNSSQITAIINRAVTVFMAAYGPNTEALIHQSFDQTGTTENFSVNLPESPRLMDSEYPSRDT